MKKLNKYIFEFRKDYDFPMAEGVLIDIFSSNEKTKLKYLDLTLEKDDIQNELLRDHPGDITDGLEDRLQDISEEMTSIVEDADGNFSQKIWDIALKLGLKYEGELDRGHKFSISLKDEDEAEKLAFKVKDEVGGNKLFPLPRFSPISPKE